MDTETLRATQAPLKAKYRDDPEAALVTLRARGSIDEAGITCKVDTGRVMAAAGLHTASGGTGMELCSGDMLLEALVACAGVTLRAVSTAIEVPVRSGTVTPEGEIDFRGTLGVSRDAPVGFRDIRLTFSLDTDAADDKLATLLKLTERYCVVLQTIRNGTPTTAAISRG